MNIFKKIKVSIIANYMMDEVIKLSKNNSMINDSIRIERSNNCLSIIIKYGSDLELFTASNFLKYYKIYSDKERKQCMSRFDFNHNVKLPRVYKRYKEKPSARFCKHLVNISNKYNKSTKPKTRDLYIAVHDYIQDHVNDFRINSKPEFFNCRAIIFASMLNSCKITIKY